MFLAARLAALTFGVINNENPFIMTFRSLFSLFVLLLLCTSCGDEEILPTEPLTVALEEEDAVLVVESTLSAETEGILAEIEQGVDLVETAELNPATLECGVTQDSTFDRSREGRVFTSSSFNSLNWTPICNEFGRIVQLDYLREGSGRYDSDRLSGSYNSNGDWSFTDLLTGRSLIVNGTFTRSGSSSFTGRDQTRERATTTTFTYTDIAVSKLSRRPESGTVSFVITTANNQGQEQRFEGTVEFRVATLLVTIGGNNYVVSRD